MDERRALFRERRHSTSRSSHVRRRKARPTRIAPSRWAHAVCHTEARDPTNRRLSSAARTLISVADMRSSGSFVVASLLSVSLAIVACGGKAIEPAPGGGAHSGGGGLSSGGGGQGGGGGTSVGTGCVTFSASDFDDSCKSDSDCTTVTLDVCPGQCLCQGDTAVNAYSQAYDNYSAKAQQVSQSVCGCIAEGPAAICSNKKCVACASNSSLSGCAFGGGGDTDAGIISDPPPPEDAGFCVNAPLSEFSTACTVDTDCVLVRTGEICSGECSCGGSSMAAASLPAYDVVTAGIEFDTCPCPYFGKPACVNNACSACGAPGQSPCPD
jgi:hypothetical protein